MRLKNLMKRIPRPLQAIVCSVLVIFLAIAYYISLGCPTLTLQQEFRRAEKIHMVGPSTIVDRLSYSEYSEFDGLIVGETEEGICFFGRYYNSSSDYGNPFAEKQHFLSYVKKTGDLTLAAAPNTWGVHWLFGGFRRSVPVYLFADVPEAVRAVVEITITDSFTSHSSDGETTTHSFQHTFRADAVRSENGFFRFTLSADQENALYALSYLSAATGSGPFSVGAELQTPYTATVPLYDEAGNLIVKKTIMVGGT